MPITMTLRLDEDINDRLSKLAESTDRSKSYLAMQALKQFLDSNDWQVQAISEALSEADAASPNEFVDNETIENWMDSWGTEQEQKPPL